MKIYSVQRQNQQGIWQHNGPQFKVEDGREFMFLEALSLSFTSRVVDDTPPDIEIFYQFFKEQGLIRLDMPDETEEFIFVICEPPTFLKAMQDITDKVRERFDGKYHVLSICVWLDEIYLLASRGTVTLLH